MGRVRLRLHRPRRSGAGVSRDERRRRTARPRHRGQHAGVGQLLVVPRPPARVDRRRAPHLPARRAHAETRAARDRASVAAAVRPARRDRGVEHVPAALLDRARTGADRPDDMLRRDHRSVQCHLPAAGRGRRAALERRRRRAQGNEHERPVPEPAAIRRAHPGRLRQRAAAASLRVHRPRPPGSLRRQRAHGRPGREAPGFLVWRRHGRRSPRKARADAERRAVEPGGRARLPAAPRRSDHDAAARSAHAAGTSRPLHVRGDHEGVPHGAEGRVHDRQRELRRPRDARSRRVDAARPDEWRLAHRHRPSHPGSGRVVGVGQRHQHEPRPDREQPHERRAARA